MKKNTKLDAVVDRILQESKIAMNQFQKKGAIFAIDQIYKNHKGYEIRESIQWFIRENYGSFDPSKNQEYLGFRQMNVIIQEKNVDVLTYVEQELNS